MVLAFAAASLLSVDTAAFASPGARLPVVARARAAPPISMVAAKDVFAAYAEASPPLQKTLKDLAPPVAKGSVGAVVGAAAAVGYVLTPSSRLAVNAVGGVLTGTAGFFGLGKRLAEERQAAAAPAAAQLLAGGLADVTSEKLEGLADDYGVPRDEFAKQLGSLYQIFLTSCLTSPKVEPPELSELRKLATLLKLSPAQIGDQVYGAGRQLYSRHRAYLEEDEANESKQLLEKFIFLAERILSGDESEEGYRYEVTRLQRLFKVAPAEWRGRAEDAAVPQYEKVLQNAVVEGKAATPEQVSGIRESLGISLERGERLHADSYSRLAEQLLGDGSAGFGADARQRLGAAQAVVQLPDAAAASAREGLATPLYQKALTEALASPADAAGAVAGLEGRREALMIGADAARAAESETARARLGEAFEEATRLLRAQNADALTPLLREILGTSASLGAFVGALGGDGGDSLFDGVAAAAARESERLGMYRLQLLDALQDLKVDDKEAAELASLRGLLGLSESDTAGVYQAAAGPLFRKAVAAAVEGELGASQSAELQTQLADLALPAAVTSQISVSVYEEKLSELASAGGSGAAPRILNEEEAARLGELRTFLDLEMSAVQGAHKAAFGEAYESSVKEVMGVTGAIPDEYWDGLDKLRARLGLTDEVGGELFAKVAKGKMREFAQKAIEAMEQEGQAAARAQQAGGDDPLIRSGAAGLGIDAGGSSLTTEVLNLVDFCEAARVLTEEVTEIKQGDGITTKKKVAVCAASLADDVPDKMRTQLYRQYLVKAFSSSNSAKNARLFGNLEKLALVLGLQDGAVRSVHDELGGVIYRQYCGRALQNGALGDQERMFLGQIKSTLDMEQETCDKLVRDCELGRVRTMVDVMFERGQVLAPDVRKMRDMADTLDVDLVKDLDVRRERLDRMFTVELENMVDEGEVTAGDLGAIEELAEPLHVEDADAQKLLVKLVTERCSSGLLQATADLRGSDQPAAATELGRVLKFAGLAPEVAEGGVALPSISAAEKQELFLLYQANSLTAGEADASKAESIALLKEVLGLQGDNTVE